MIYNPTFAFIGSGYVLHLVPFAVIVLVIVYILAYVFLEYTELGRNIFFVGGNPLASRLAGINVDRTRIIVFVLAGALSSVSGIFFASIVGSSLPFGASGYSLSAIAAVILGGTSLAGGLGTIQGTLLGVLILGVLSNGLTLISVQSFWQTVVTGAVLIGAVAIDQIRSRRQE